MFQATILTQTMIFLLILLPKSIQALTTPQKHHYFLTVIFSKAQTNYDVLPISAD